MSAGFLSALTRPELDELLDRTAHAYKLSHAVLAHCPLTMEAVCDAANVAQDCLTFWQDCLNESIMRLTAEMRTRG
jgi:hypothetical protein